MSDTLDDLYAPDFPHGSPDGYDAGCHGAACTYHGDPHWLSCREAKELKRGDYSYRNKATNEPWPREVVLPKAPAQPRPKPASIIAGDRQMEIALAAAEGRQPATVTPQREVEPTATPPAAAEQQQPIGGPPTPGRRVRPFTEADKTRLRELHTAGTKTTQIALDLDRAPSMIYLWINKLGLNPIKPSIEEQRVPDPAPASIETASAEDLVTPPAEATSDDGPVFDIRACRVCGCTDDDCSDCIARTGHPCSWDEYDLCSACNTTDRIAVLEEQVIDLENARDILRGAADEAIAGMAAAEQRAEAADRAAQAAELVIHSPSPAVGTGGESTPALAAPLEQIKLIVAHTEQGMRLQLAVPASGSATLNVVDGAVSLTVGR